MEETMETEAPSKSNGVEAMETGSPKNVPANKELDERRKYDWTEDIKPHIKIAVMGESGCGKSSLILAAKNQIFPHPCEKFVSKRYYLEVKVDDKVEECMVTEIDDWDENSDRREKIYTEKNVVVLLCFNNRLALTNMEGKWVPELESHDVPIIFVKILKEGDDEDLESGRLPENTMECCPHAKEGVEEVFQEAVKKTKKA
ncbi:unnamed protein product [Larinioides sclopetarius]|uniref:Uncharacterized protein n=1 Tax=Larinioides sclopetarius TaxID=280406 RepID=A0AAV2ATD8_9ARAC